VAALERDLASGECDHRHRHLRWLPALDAGPMSGENPSAVRTARAALVSVDGNNVAAVRLNPAR
jgi:hypothetical protein